MDELNAASNMEASGQLESLVQAPAASTQFAEGFRQVVESGGPVVIILIVLSLIALTIIVFKFVELFVFNSKRSRRLDAAIGAWKLDQRLEALTEISGAKRGTRHVVQVVMRARYEQHPDGLVREEVQRVLAQYRERLNAHLRTLDVIGAISPLLGLFGTVLGMIQAFRQMEAAGSNVDPSVLSGGIWQALLTTGVGLAVAIPVVLAHQWLERRADSLLLSTEDAVTQVFTADLHGRESNPQVPISMEDRHAA